MKNNTTILLLFLILLVAVISAANALDAWNASAGHHQVFYENNNGREGLFINLIAYSFKFFGPSFAAYKLPGCLIGVLSVLGIFFLASEVSRKKYVGLLSSFLMAISFWMVLFDRMGLRAVLSVMCVTWVSYFFLKALRTNKWHDYALAGIFLGIGLNSYIAFRLLPIAIVAGVIYKIVLSRRVRGTSVLATICSHRKFILVIIISAVIVMPLAIYYFHHLDFLTARTSDVSVFSQSHTLKLLADSTLANLSIFNFYGDPNWRHNFAKLPILDMLQGLLLILGLIIMIRYVFRKQSDLPDEVIQNKTNYFYILIVFVLMIGPAVLTNTSGGIPHSLRIIDTAPSMFVIIAIGFSALYEKMKIIFISNKRVVIVGLVVILSSLALHNALLYFVRWGQNDQVAHEYAQDYTEVSRFINKEAGQGNRAFIVSNSSEIDFFTLRTPNVKKVFSLSNMDAIQEFNPKIIVFTNFQSGDSDALNLLVSQGWRLQEGMDFGKGSHTIKILTKIE